MKGASRRHLLQKIRLDPSRIPIVRQVFLSIFRHFEQSEPSFFDISIIAKQNLSSGVNIVSVGSPSRILMVRRISLGMTTRPRSSILLTIPVAFIYNNSFPVHNKANLTCKTIICKIPHFILTAKQEYFSYVVWLFRSYIYCFS